MPQRDQPRGEGAKRRPDPPVLHPGRFAYEGLQRAFHEKARLGIMTSLISQPNPLSFSDLKELCALSDGNLNRHLDVLREAGFVEMEKTGAGRAAKSICRVTELGRVSFARYLSELEQVIADANRRTRSTTDSPPGTNRRPGTNPSLGIEY